MNKHDEELAEEILDTMPGTSKELPEAPLSTHIDAYYKGFHTGITIRSLENGSLPTSKIMVAIDSLIEKGFKPSWNEDTNKTQLAPTGQAPTRQPTTSQTVSKPVAESKYVCSVCGNPMTEKTGKFGTFWSCGTKDNGVWCKGKAVTPEEYYK